MTPSAAFTSLALSLAIHSASQAAAFSPAAVKPRHVSSTSLNYRSLHHGPDVEPLSHSERQGAAFTKTDKDEIDRYGPGDFARYADHAANDFFDGGDSEMGLSGDGNVGLQKIGRDVSPHMERTLSARMDQTASNYMSYADELLQNNADMDSVRAHQLENWATQNEIALANRYSYTSDVSQTYQRGHATEYGGVYEDESSFDYPIEAGDEVGELITMRAPLYGAASLEIALKNPFMGFAKFRAAFVGDSSSEWSVTPDDGYLKQNEATHFVVRYNPHNHGVSNTYLVIETEDFKKTWKVVGSTGEYGF